MQTEAKFNAEEVFYVDKAPKELEPFRLGGFQFWKESGCDWKEQMKKHRNIKRLLQSKENEDWLKIAKRVQRQDKKREMEYNEQRSHRLDTNQIVYVPQELQDLNAKMKRDKLGTPHIVAAFEKLKNLHHYIPGAATILSQKMDS